MVLQGDHLPHLGTWGSLVSPPALPPGNAPKEGLAASIGPGVQRDPPPQQGDAGPPAAPRGCLWWDPTSGESHEGAPGAHQSRVLGAELPAPGSRAPVQQPGWRRAEEMSRCCLRDRAFSSLFLSFFFFFFSLFFPLFARHWCWVYDHLRQLWIHAGPDLFLTTLCIALFLHGVQGVISRR